MTKSDFTNTSKLLLQKLLVFALLLFYGATTKSQDTIVVLSAKQFDKFDQLGIAAYKGWVYHAGNNKAWAQKEVNTSAWQKRNPFDVNAKDANKTGRAEGWFRIKVRIDSSLASKALKMSFSSYAATDVFINGVHLYSSGNSGLFGGAYKEEIRRTPQLYALNFKPGVDYVIALHIVDYLTPLNPFRLKSEGSHSLGIITPETVTKANEFRATIANICIITLTTSVLLTGLFWFLYFSNRTEKNLLIISLALSFCAIFYTSVFLYNVSVEMHTTTAVWYYTLLNVSYCLYILCSLIILVRISIGVSARVYWQCSF